jgi:hypothetical protein
MCPNDSGGGTESQKFQRMLNRIPAWLDKWNVVDGGGTDHDLTQNSSALRRAHYARSRPRSLNALLLG